MNFYLSNLEELLKYVPQAYEEKKKKYLDNVDEQDKNSSNEGTCLLGNKRNSPLELSPERRNNSVMSPAQPEPQTVNNNIIKIPIINLTNNLQGNYCDYKMPSVHSQVYTQNLPDLIHGTEGNNQHAENYLKFIFIQIKQLESRLKQAHSEIKRFDMISNAYSMLSGQSGYSGQSGQDLSTIQSHYPINFNSINTEHNNNIFSSLPLNPIWANNLFNIPNIHQIKTDK